MAMSDDRLSSCYGKERFKSWHAAGRVMKRRARNRNRETANQKPYRCRYCGEFHIGYAIVNRPRKALQRFLSRYVEVAHV